MKIGFSMADIENRRVHMEAISLFTRLLILEPEIIDKKRVYMASVSLFIFLYVLSLDDNSTTFAADLGP